jgi:hypothetical protein
VPFEKFKQVSCMTSIRRLSLAGDRRQLDRRLALHEVRDEANEKARVARSRGEQAASGWRNRELCKACWPSSLHCI